MEHKTLKEAYKNISEEVKESLEEKFSKRELVVDVKQEDFDKFFVNYFFKNRNNIKFYRPFEDSLYTSFYLYDTTTHKWLFILDFSEFTFSFSYYRVLPDLLEFLDLEYSGCSINYVCEYIRPFVMKYFGTPELHVRCSKSIRDLEENTFSFF